MINENSYFRCVCNKKTKYKITFDGGTTGDYVLELCTKCYPGYDKEFLISEEIL